MRCCICSLGGDLDLNMEQSLKERWQVIVGDEYEIVVCDNNTFLLLHYCNIIIIESNCLKVSICLWILCTARGKLSNKLD